jgi:H+/Cl- antiporter ClcA
MHLLPFLLALLFLLLTLGVSWLLAKAWFHNRNEQDQVHPDVYVGFAVLGIVLAIFNHFFRQCLQMIPDNYDWLAILLATIILGGSGILIYRRTRKQGTYEDISG